jgi:hypothetical protein
MTAGELAADYTLYVYIVYKFEYVLFLILYIFFETTMPILFNRTVTTYISYFLHSHFADKAPFYGQYVTCPLAL